MNYVFLTFRGIFTSYYLSNIVNNSQNLMYMEKRFSKLMQLLALVIALAFVAPVMVNAQSGKANFAGTWALNAEKSNLPQGGGGGGRRMGGGGTFTVTQEGNVLTQTRTGQDGTARSTKYTLDGKESVNAFGQGESKSTATWSADGKSLTIVTKMSFNGNERTSSAVWSLVDAKTLSIVSTRQGQNGEVKTTMIYDKK
jgi:hypothetical protein